MTISNSDLDRPEVWQARVDLAACFRAAARLGLHEGVCNHLSFMVPGRDDVFLVNPDGWSFAEITASRLLICDFHRRVVAGDGVPEDTAFFIHARLHARLPRARAAFHTHMPNATALTMVEGDPLVWAGQSALKFYGRTVVDDAYNGLALDESEGDRIAASCRRRGHRVHEASWRAGAGVRRSPRPGTICIIWNGRARCSDWRNPRGDWSYRCPSAVAEATAEQMRHEGGRDSPRLHLESIKRQLDRDTPEYRQ